MCSFFRSRRTSRLHIGVTSMDMPRERAAILRQRDASERYIFRLLLQRPPPPPPVDTCYFFISIQWRALSLQNGNQRFVTLHYPLRSDARHRFYTLRAFFTAASGHLDEGGVTRSPPHGRLIIKKITSSKVNTSRSFETLLSAFYFLFLSNRIMF